MKYNSVAFLLGTIKFSFTKRYSISFPSIFHNSVPILKASLVLMGKTFKIVQSLYVHLKDRKKQGGSKFMFMPFEIVSICVWLWYLFQKHVVLQLIHNYINSTCYDLISLMSAYSNSLFVFIPCFECWRTSGGITSPWY